MITLKSSALGCLRVFSREQQVSLESFEQNTSTLRQDGAESEISAKAAESEASDASLQESGPSRLEVRGENLSVIFWINPLIGTF